MVNKFLLIIVLLVHPCFSQSDSLLIFSEIMFYPSAGNNEFIEIYNLNSSQPIELGGYSIKYYSSSADQIVDAGYGTLILPNSYAIIFENDYDIQTGIYKDLVPANALILKIADNSFGSSGMANTTNRPLWLLNPADENIDFCFYSANNQQIHSDEKILLNRDSLQTNWSNSLSINGTPGFVNSVSPVDYDLYLYSLAFSPSNPSEGDSVDIKIKIRNNGLLSAENFSVEVFNDVDSDSVGEPGEGIYTQFYSTLLSDDSISVEFILDSLIPGTHQIIAEVVFNEDEFLPNNFLISQVIVSPKGNDFNDIIINEIMYAPSSGEPEWLEFYNRTNEPVNLRNWKLSDASSTITITDQDKIVAPNSFVVVTEDSSLLNYFSVHSEIIEANIPALNNGGDAVVIKDINNSVIDSVNYLPVWGGNSEGRSLERISEDQPGNDAENWGTSLSTFKATPGTYNSLTQKDFDIKVGEISFLPVNPLYGDSINISATINNIGKNEAQFSVSLFEDTDLDSIPDLFVETTPGFNLPASDSLSLAFAYKILNIRNTRAFYIKAFFVPDMDTTNNTFYKDIKPGFPVQSIIINEIMFAPSGGEPEWIELYNNSDIDIDLNEWSISDIITTPFTAKIKNECIIMAKNFIVLTKDSSVINYHRYIASPLTELSLASYNNDRDGVVLKDNRSLTIDSVFYSNQWGGTEGNSLERISTTNSSNNQYNWASSKDVEQSTPGRINSITPKVNDLSAVGIYLTPRFPVSGDEVTLNTKIKNNGTQPAQNITTQIFVDTDSNNVVDFLFSSVNIPGLSAGDSVTIVFPDKILNLRNKILTAVRIFYPPDEDTLNNYLEKFIEPGFSANTIKINEVMYFPPDSTPEWIELVNLSPDTINLKNWFISDVFPSPSKSFITGDNFYIDPGEIFIIAADTSFNFAYPAVNSKILYTNFGNLGNTSDGVVIYDFRNGIIDSLFYRSKWGRKKGYSLERISVIGQTNDSTNWVTSLDTSGATPGRQNSIFEIPSYSRNDLVVNEIMFDPGTNNSEYIEFYNLSDNFADIGGWKFEDKNRNSYKLSETSFLIQPKDYFLIVADSSAVNHYNLFEYSNKHIAGESNLGLINTGGLILLKDVRGNVIDSVFYSDNWNNENITITKNKSIERINPAFNGNDPLNWSTSADPDGGTPGYQNSIFAENLNNEKNITISSNPFSPDNDGFEDFTIINYNLTQATAQVRIKIFDSKGRLVRTLLNNQASGQNGSVIFNGLDDDGKALRIGIYIIFLEALNDNLGVLETLKTVAVVARKL